MTENAQTSSEELFNRTTQELRDGAKELYYLARDLATKAELLAARIDIATTIASVDFTVPLKNGMAKVESMAGSADLLFDLPLSQSTLLMLEAEMAKLQVLARKNKAIREMLDKHTQELAGLHVKHSAE